MGVGVITYTEGLPFVSVYTVCTVILLAVVSPPRLVSIGQGRRDKGPKSRFLAADGGNNVACALEERMRLRNR